MEKVTTYMSEPMYTNGRWQAWFSDSPSKHNPFKIEIQLPEKYQPTVLEVESVEEVKK
jgi:hypothetical protein